MVAIFDKNINIVEDKDFTFGNRAGHRMIIEAPKPSNLKMMIVWTVKGSLGYIFTFLARADQYKEFTPTVDRLVKSFEFI
jgi:hypothetical protein